MTEIVDYKDMDVAIFTSDANPAAKVAVALAITMKQDPCADIYPVKESKLLDIIMAEHLSVLEHVNYTFLIENVSRSFLAQITRQRMAAPTSGSQHYQNYSNYPMVIDGQYKDELTPSLTFSLEEYKRAIELGVPKEEARQVLPNASAVNYLWTINAHSLYKFLYMRLCNRNVKEMRVFASKVLKLVQGHFPEFFNHCGPQCFLRECEQHRLGMQCKAKHWVRL